MAKGKIYDCIIIGAGPGGLQAAIYLCRYNRKVLILDRSGGRTQHAKHIENFHRFFGESFFTCVDCDGYKTTGKKLVIIGNSEKTLRLALAMKQMFTKNITVVLSGSKTFPDYEEVFKEENIKLLNGEPAGIIGQEKIEGLELKDGRKVECEVIMSNFGYRLNDDFLSELSLRKDSHGFKYVVGDNFETSLTGLYIVGPLNTGNDQVVIAAGEGAVAAIDINKRLLEIHAGE